MIWLSLAVAAIGLVVVVSASALVEVFRQLAEIRRALHLEDESLPLGVKSGELSTEEIGLPASVALEPAATVVFLSTKCATCLAIAETFRGGTPPAVWFVLPEHPEPRQLLEVLSSSAERIIVDKNDTITNLLGLHVTPSALITSFGQIREARALSSTRQLQALLPTVLPRQASSASSAPDQHPGRSLAGA